MEVSLEGMQQSKVRPFRLGSEEVLFSFLMANPKGRFQIGVAPKALVFDRFMDWDFDIGVSEN